MRILAIDCSAGPVSAAICENGEIISSDFKNIKVTHSQTLMPTVVSVLKSANLTLADIDGFALSAGPGSFTGIRIGIAAIKGLAAAKNTPCVSVSTLRGMAEGFTDFNGVLCCVMDARCNQVYNALFEIKDGAILRLCDDRAIYCDDLKAELLNINGNITVCGDGCDMFYELVKDLKNISKASEDKKYQNAAFVARLGYKEFVNGNTVSPDELLPVYLRLPQAERELKARSENNENCSRL